MKKFFAFLLLAGCVGTQQFDMGGFRYMPMQSGDYEIATWQKINNPQNNHIHIYIEGDGNSFNAFGMPTDNPTPRGTLVREMALSDGFENVAYVARPCQFIMSENCSESVWTNARFSQKVIDSESNVIKQIAGNKKIVIIGYSGGAMISGLVILQNPELKIDKWITVAGVLDHAKWTDYFNDMALDGSLNMDKLPNVRQVHFVGGHDEVVPYNLAKTWAKASDLVLIDGATHDNFQNLKIFD